MVRKDTFVPKLARTENEIRTLATSEIKVVLDRDKKDESVILGVLSKNILGG